MRKNLSDLPDGDDDKDVRMLTVRQMRIETQPVDWDAFWKSPSGEVPFDKAVQAAIDSRGDR